MEDTYNDVWCIDVDNIAKLLNGTILENENVWQLIKTTGPGPGKISNHKAVVLESRIFVYGGLINNENTKNSLFSLDTMNNTWYTYKIRVIP